MHEPINLVADYKDESGRYFHRAYKALGAVDEETAARTLAGVLRLDGFIPCAIAAIYGDHSLEELEQIAERLPQPGEGRLLYIDKAEYGEPGKEDRRHE